MYHLDMPGIDPPQGPQLGDLLACFAGGMVAAQSQLDAEWSDSVEQYRKALPENCGEWAELARMLIPARQVIAAAELETRAVCRRAKSTEFRIEVRPVGLGYERKFEQTAFVGARIQMTVSAYTPSQTEKQQGK